MKKYFFLVLLFIVFLSPIGASALTLENGLEITEDNLRYYFDEIIYYQNLDFYDNYKYCVEENNSSSTSIKYYCFDEDNKNKITKLYYRSSSMYYQLNSSGLRYKGVSFNKSDFTYTIYQSLNNMTSPLWNIRYFNFDYIDSNGVILESNWESIINSNYFTVKFDIPSNVNLIVKDINGEKMVSIDNNVYSLKVGDYIYIIESELYETLEVNFSVSEEMTINPELVSKLDLKKYNELFSDFYLVVKDFSNKIFNLGNPLFLIGASFLIFIALILLIKKFLGGI